jgi:hypothetical protein
MAVVVAVVIVSPFVSYALALGTKEAKNLYCNPQTRTFLSFKTVEHQTYDNELMRINRDGGLRFLTQTKDLVIVFAKPLSPCASSVGKREYQPLVFVVPMADLISVRNDDPHSKR